MNKGTLDYFSVLVIGQNPDEQILKFDMMEDVKNPYIIYNYSDLNKIRKNKIKIYKELIKSINILKDKEVLLKKIDELKNITDEQYYFSLSELNMLDSNKNIISTENPDGKWLTCEKGGKIFSNYMKDNNDNGIISCKKNDVAWPLTHMKKDKTNLYDRTWELCVNDLSPETDKDKNIINNMKSYKIYFNSFKNKKEYIKMSCSFWTYAVCINGEWVDMDDKDEFDWISNFYEKFIEKLPSDELITIYECTK